MFGSRVTIVMYHAVAANGDRWTVSPDSFRQQMEFFKRLYVPIHLRDIPLHMGRHRRRRIIITFDDAFTDVIERAYPVMERLGIPFTIFVPTGHVGGTNSWDRGRSFYAEKAIMSADQLVALAQDTIVDFGSHSIDHRSMGRLTRPEMDRQAIDSRRYLEQLLRRPVNMFAYPYGDYGDFTSETEQALKDAGYRLAVTTRWGSRNRRNDLLRLRRISFARDASIDDVKTRVEGWYDVKDTWLYRSAMRVRKQLRTA